MNAFTNPRKALYYGYDEFLARQDCAESWKVQRALRALERSHKIKLLKKNDKILIKLESNGKVAWLIESIKMKKEPLPIGMNCLVLFDIPEELSKVRRSFRNQLKSCGFVFEQRSAWVTDKSVIQELQKLVRMLKIQEYVTICLIQKIDG
jgi:DNA-binding transcriptional regulator PaaX